MSFILDALRKSDAERQRTAAPGIADVRYATRRSRRSIWLPILVAVLAANVVFMGVQWYGRTSSQPVATAPPPGPTATAPPLAAPVPTTVGPPPVSTTRPLAREAEFGEPEPGPALDSEPEVMPVAKEGTAQASSAGDSPPAPTPPGTVPEGAPAPPPAPSRILPDNDLPTAEQVIGSGAVKIPILNLDLHVYSDNAANRFVIINSHRYKEGGQITEGPTVESITKDGVILAFQGRRFTLSRR